MTPEAMAELHAVCFVHPRPWTAAAFAAVLAGPGVVLVERPGGPAPPGPRVGQARHAEGAGFLLGRVVADEAEILTLAVAPAARRRGLGAGLLAQFLIEAGERGAARVFLEVAEDNPAAMALYRGAGFAEAGRRRGYAAPGVDSLVLARDLT
jgi:ribosomal-protein-alanine N-acetyltransferase